MAARWPPLHLCTAAAAVFLLTLILPRTPAEGKPSAQPHAVPAPFNLKITSYNLNSTLYWDYERSSATHFQVEIKNYSKGAVWTLVKNCKNIKHNYCDLSKNIVNPDTFYYIRVKAFNGIAASDYSEMEFSLRVDGIIGPPRLNLSLEGKSIIIDILHPPVPHLGRKTTVSDFYKDFDYKIFFQNNTEHQTEECDEQKCTAYLFPSTKDAYYCFSAQGWSEDYAVLGEKSEEACIFVPDEEAIKSFRTKIIMATAFGVFFSVLVILIIIFVINAMMKSKTNLPKSLDPTHPFVPRDMVVMKQLNRTKGQGFPFGPPTTLIAETRTHVLVENSNSWIHASRMKKIPKKPQQAVPKNQTQGESNDDILSTTTCLYILKMYLPILYLSAGGLYSSLGYCVLYLSSRRLWTIPSRKQTNTYN